MLNNGLSEFFSNCYHHSHSVVKKMEREMLSKKLEKSYTEFYDATVENGTFDIKTTLMIQLAAAFAIGCYP